MQTRLKLPTGRRARSFWGLCCVSFFILLGFYLFRPAQERMLTHEKSHGASVSRVHRMSLMSESRRKVFSKTLRQNHGPYGGQEKSLPHVIIAGVKKCGTKALLEFVGMHPNVVTATVAGVREPHFFDREENYEKGLEWYRETFMPETSPGQITIEKTPKYFVTEKAPERIHNMNSSIKILFIMREPVYRTVSDYLHERKINPEIRTEETFEEFAIDQSTGELNETHEEIQTSIYHRHFQRWLRYFNRSQIHIVDGESLVRDPFPEVVKAEQFLGLERQLTSKSFVYDEKKGYYCRMTKRGKSCLGPEKGKKHPEVKQEVWDKLCRYFQPHNEILFEMIGQRFDWSCFF